MEFQTITNKSLFFKKMKSTIWGPLQWGLYHEVARQVDELLLQSSHVADNIKSKLRNAMNHLVDCSQCVYPCEMCRENFRDFYRSNQCESYTPKHEDWFYSSYFFDAHSHATVKHNASEACRMMGQTCAFQWKTFKERLQLWHSFTCENAIWDLLSFILDDYSGVAQTNMCSATCALEKGPTNLNTKLHPTEAKESPSVRWVQIRKYFCLLGDILGVLADANRSNHQRLTFPRIAYALKLLCQSEDVKTLKQNLDSYRSEDMWFHSWLKDRFDYKAGSGLMTFHIQDSEPIRFSIVKNTPK